MVAAPKCPRPLWRPPALNRALPRSWMVLLSSNFLRRAGKRLGTPSMCCGVLKALGPPGQSLSTPKQGGASMIRATIPDQQSLRSASKTLSSRMLRAASPSRSKGSKQSRPRLMAADVTGCSLPANTSKKSRFEAGCNCESDELAWAGACGVGLGLGSLRCAAGKAGVRAGRPGPCEGESRRGARPAEAWLPDPVPVQDPGCFTCVYCGPWRDAFAGNLLWHTRGRKGSGH